MKANHALKKPAMTGPPAAKPVRVAISAGDFPALRSFLRGYFHQDMKEEYGSAEEAVREFCEDASGDERAEVAENWSRFLDQTKGQPLEAINRILTGPLGGSCRLTEEEVRGISAALSPTKRPRK
jgi:hypothetical protein